MAAYQSAEKSLVELLAETLQANTSGSASRAPDTFVFDYLRQSGGADPTDLAIDGSVTPVAFEWTAPAQGVVLWRVNFAAIAAAAEDVDGFFGLAELTNGLLLELVVGGVVVETFETDTIPITTHNDLAALAGVDVVSDSVGNRSRFGIRWTLANAGKAPLMPAGSVLRVTVRDNLSTLLRFRVMAQGYLAA